MIASPLLGNRIAVPGWPWRGGNPESHSRRGLAKREREAPCATLRGYRAYRAVSMLPPFCAARDR